MDPLKLILAEYYRMLVAYEKPSDNFIESVKKYTKKPLDVHLMIINPDNYIEKFAELGSSVLTVHFEACTHLHRTIQRIKSLNMKAGVAINPHTPISSLESIIKEIDLVCIMSVNPGFGGQSFIETTYQKIKDLKFFRFFRETAIGFFVFCFVFPFHFPN